MAIYGIVDLFARSLGLLTSPFVTRLLTQTQYGAGPLLSSIWAPVALLQYGGMDSAYPYFKAKDTDEVKHHELITTATFISNISCFFIWFIFLLVAMSGNWLNTYAHITKFELFLFVLALLPAGLIYWLLYLLRFQQKAMAFVRITLLGRILPFLATIPIMLVIAQPDRLLAMWGVGCIIQILALIYALYEIKRANLWPFILLNFSTETAKKMLKYGLLLAPIAMLYALSTVMDKIIVGWFMGPDDVAILQLAIAVASISTMLASWFGLAFDPHLVQWIASKNNVVYERKLQIIIYTITGVFLCFTWFAAIWSDWLFYILYPQNYAQSANLVPFLVFASIFPILSRIAIATIIIADKPKFQMILYGIAFFINLSICLYCIPRFGLIGSVIATIASELFINIAWIFLGKIYFKNLNLFWGNTYILILLTLTGLIIYDPGATGSFEGFIQATIASLTILLCLITYWRFTFGKDLFKKIINMPTSYFKELFKI